MIRIAIDGPAGAGKSTVARLLANRLRILYIDTGAMYRALTWKLLELGMLVDDAEAIARLAESVDIELIFDPDREIIVICDGQDVTEQIRSPQVSAAVSYVAQIPAVRERMSSLQQTWARQTDIVMDGRDIGTIVIPDAEYKFFLTACLEKRVQRRMLDLAEKAYFPSYQQVENDIVARDAMDSNRTCGPLLIAEDAICIDTSKLSADQVADYIVKIVQPDNRHAL